MPQPIDEAPASAAQPTKPSVLIVDDQADVREFLRDILEGEFDIVTAEDGRAAMKLLTLGELRPQVAMVDILMPEKDGFETIAEMRQIHPTIKVIAMSGGGRVVQLDLLTIAAELGAEHLMRKPLEPTAVRTLLRSLAA